MGRWKDVSFGVGDFSQNGLQIHCRLLDLAVVRWQKNAMQRMVQYLWMMIAKILNRRIIRSIDFCIYFFKIISFFDLYYYVVDAFIFSKLFLFAIIVLYT